MDAYKKGFCGSILMSKTGEKKMGYEKRIATLNIYSDFKTNSVLRLSRVLDYYQHPGSCHDT